MLSPKLLVAGIGIALASILAGCTGGGSEGGAPAAVALQLLPEEITLFPGGVGEFQIVGGRRPFSVTVDNPAAVSVDASDETRIRVVASATSIESTVRVTIRDAGNATATGSVKIMSSLVTSEVTIEALPSSGGDQTVNRCQDGTTLCAGELARVTARVTNPAGSSAGRPLRFDVIEGQFAYTTDPNFTQLASTVTVITDSLGTASAVIRATANVSTQPATLRVTDEPSGSRQSVAFTIGGRNLAVIPAELELVGPRRGVCGSGTGDFQVFGGRPPYTITSLSPYVILQSAGVAASGGKFRVSVTPPASCTGFTATLSVADSQGAVVTAAVDVREGTTSPPVLSVAPSTVSIGSCSSHASLVYTGSAIAVAAPGELVVSTGPSLITVSPAQGAINGTYALAITDGSSNATVTVTLVNLPAGGCP